VGFNVLGFVVDKKMLAVMAAKIGAVGSVALTTVLAYRETRLES
jgi:hypothetical protein